MNAAAICNALKQESKTGVKRFPWIVHNNFKITLARNLKHLQLQQKSSKQESTVPQLFEVQTQI